MTDSTNTETTEQNEKSSFYEYLHKVLMAGIGAVALAQDEIETFVQKMLERGEIAEKEAKTLLDEVKSRRKEHVKKTEEALDKQLENLLSRMSIPTKTDLEDLRQRIQELSDKIDQLSKRGED